MQAGLRRSHRSSPPIYQKSISIGRYTLQLSCTFATVFSSTCREISGHVSLRWEYFYFSIIDTQYDLLWTSWTQRGNRFCLNTFQPFSPIIIVIFFVGKTQVASYFPPFLSPPCPLYQSQLNFTNYNVVNFLTTRINWRFDVYRRKEPFGRAIKQTKRFSPNCLQLRFSCIWMQSRGSWNATQLRRTRLISCTKGTKDSKGWTSIFNYSSSVDVAALAKDILNQYRTAPVMQTSLFFFLLQKFGRAALSVK